MKQYTAIDIEELRNLSMRGRTTSQIPYEFVKHYSRQIEINESCIEAIESIAPYRWIREDPRIKAFNMTSGRTYVVVVE